MNLDSPRSARRGTVAALRTSNSGSPPTAGPLFFGADAASPKTTRTTTSSPRAAVAETLLSDRMAKHLLFELRSLPAFDVPATQLEVQVSLTSKQSTDIPLYEPFVTLVSPDGRLTCSAGPRGLHTVFLDLPATFNDMMLVIKIFSVGPIILDGKSSSLLGRRPVAATSVLLSTIGPLKILGMDALEVAQVRLF